MNGALLAALKESASTRRGKAEAKELTHPSTTLLRWRHGFARAKRRKFKFTFFAVRVSVDKILRLNF
nr:hypothetical protein [uncultured Campylobacter sp.]